MKYLEFIFQSFWHFCGFAFLFYLVLFYATNGLLKLFNRILRTINVLSRGWPPEHLDADGDHKDTIATMINPFNESTSKV